MNLQNSSVILLIFALTLCWVAPETAAQSQASRAASAASYLERGNSWMAKGEVDRAIADYDLAIAFDSRVAAAYHNRSLARARKGGFGRGAQRLQQRYRVEPASRRGLPQSWN